MTVTPVHFIDQFRQLCRFLDISSLADAGCGDLACRDVARYMLASTIPGVWLIPRQDP